MTEPQDHRIAEALATGIVANFGTNRMEVREPSTPCSAQATLVQSILRARSKRGAFISAKLLGEPGWDMLLELYLAELRQFRLSTSSLCIASGAAPTTALRWIASLEQESLIEKRPDPLDGRRVFVSLSARASEAMRDYFSSLLRHQGYRGTASILDIHS